MIIKINDKELTNKILIDSMKWSNNKVSIEKVLGESSKYIILDWLEVDSSKIKDILPSLDKDICRKYIQDIKQTINNIDVLFEFYKYLEYPDEIMLLDSLVDNHIISNELYMSNTYRQNFDMLMKFTKFYLPLENKTSVKHQKKVIDYNGSLEELVEDIGNLQYDSLAEFLILLAEKLKIDSKKDKERGRNKLSNLLDSASLNILASSQDIEDSWVICKPYLINK